MGAAQGAWGALLGGLAVGAESLDLQGVEGRPELVLEADLPLPLVEIGIVELDDPATPRAYHVVVALARGDPLVDVVLAPEPGLAGEAALDEEVEGPVDGRAGDALALVAELKEQRVGVEMAGGVEKLFEEH